MGLGKPCYFPGETAISGEEYARWFQQIAEMNANCVRVYTVQPPAFYEAFYEYNKTAEKPLYLFQGTWYNEDQLYETENAFDETLQEYLYRDMRNLVDLIHGDCVIEVEAGHASGSYEWDISPYVIGWILGIESEQELVETTNELNPEMTSYEGKYIGAEDTTPFEVFWAQTGDYIVSYEMENYGLQRPVSFANWPTADMLVHPSETMEMEDSIVLNMENLHATELFYSGLFASYHIYPYYPDSLYTQAEYRDYRDEDGSVNTYRAYLEELIAQHSMPVLVAEFGVPASRGETHANLYTGFDQGNHTEQEQGEMLTSMMQNIHDTGYAGGLIFTWQDDWFNRTWNTEMYSDAERRAYWCDMMTCEQHFGLLSFVPGETEEAVVLDGDASEWSEKDVLMKAGDRQLSVKHDSAYLYLMIEQAGADYDTETVTIPFDITPNSGSRSYGEERLQRPADFVLIIDGRDNSEMQVQSYYDRYRFSNGPYDDEIVMEEDMREPDNDIFVPINLLEERKLVLPDRDEVVPITRFWAGEFLYGTSDYQSADYNSLSDYCYQGDILEIRIPWLLLNFRDPSRKCIEDDFWTNGELSGMNVDGIWIGVSAGEDEMIRMAQYSWEDWDMYPYFERLRKSYYMVQEQFAELGIG